MVPKKLELSKKQSEIQSINIYNTEEYYSERNIHYFLDENTPSYTLDPTQHKDFLKELFALDFEKDIVLIPIPMDGGCDYSGYIISVVYLDGSYDIIAEKGWFSYVVNERDGLYGYEHADYCGDVAWTEFIESYIQEE
jgi:hypothetical protein